MMLIIAGDKSFNSVESYCSHDLTGLTTQI